MTATRGHTTGNGMWRLVLAAPTRPLAPGRRNLADFGHGHYPPAPVRVSRVLQRIDPIRKVITDTARVTLEDRPHLEADYYIHGGLYRTEDPRVVQIQYHTISLWTRTGRAEDWSAALRGGAGCVDRCYDILPDLVDMRELTTSRYIRVVSSSGSVAVYVAQIT
jgi:hypothetical protein